MNLPENPTLEMLITIGQEVAEKEKNYQIIYGQLAILLENLPEKTSLEDFAKEIGKPSKTLSAYKSIEKRLIGLEIPQDFSWTARRVIAESDDPKQTLDNAVEHGLSSAELIKIFGKKKEQAKKEIICPHCSTKIVM